MEKTKSAKELLENLSTTNTGELLEYLQPHRNINNYVVVLTVPMRIEIIKELNARGILTAMSREELLKLLRSILPTANEPERRFGVAEALLPAHVIPSCAGWKQFCSAELVVMFNDFMIANTKTSIRHALEVFAELHHRAYVEFFEHKTQEEMQTYYSLQDGSGIYPYVDALLGMDPAKAQLIAALEYLIS
jgi:hypothetical protein